MIHFSRYTTYYFLISSVVIGIGVMSIVRNGYKVSIDFTGGAQIVYTSAQKNLKVDETQLRKAVTDIGAELVEYRVSPDGDLTIRLSRFQDAKEPQLRTHLASDLQTSLSLSSLDSVGPTIGADSIRKTLIAAGVGIVVILGYILYAFKRFTFAIAAVVALMHDILVVLGTYSLISYMWGAQLDTLFVTALLTTMSFSTHDTIVIFDTIREELRRGKGGDIASLADRAVTATMVRSLNNSLTIIFMLLALALLGGSSIRFFAIALLVGTITGAYSSPFIATPVMIWLEKRKKVAQG